MLRESNEVQKDRRQHQQTLVRQNARQAKPESKLHPDAYQTQEQHGRTRFGYANQPPQYEKNQQPWNATSQQTRNDGSTKLQLEEIPAFCDEKTKCFSPRNFPETRKALAFLKLCIHGLKNSLLSPSNFRICRLTSKTNLA